MDTPITWFFVQVQDTFGVTVQSLSTGMYWTSLVIIITIFVAPVLPFKERAKCFPFFQWILNFQSTHMFWRFLGWPLVVASSSARGSFPQVFLADGGHFDNTGVYALL